MLYMHKMYLCTHTHTHTSNAYKYACMQSISAIILLKLLLLRCWEHHKWQIPTIFINLGEDWISNIFSHYMASLENINRSYTLNWYQQILFALMFKSNSLLSGSLQFMIQKFQKLKNAALYAQTHYLSSPQLTVALIQYKIKNWYQSDIFSLCCISLTSPHFLIHSLPKYISVFLQHWFKKEYKHIIL